MSVVLYAGVKWIDTEKMCARAGSDTRTNSFIVLLVKTLKSYDLFDCPGGEAGLGGRVGHRRAQRLGLGGAEAEDEEDGRRHVRLRPVRQDLSEEQLAAAPQIRTHR